MSEITLRRADLAAADLPAYEGIDLARVTLVDSDAAAARACSVLLARDAIGFDTELKPTFRKGEVATGPHLVQLASDDRAWLFHVAGGVDRSSLQRILESAAVLKVGFGLGNDRSALRERLRIELAHVLDLGEVLRGPGHRGTVGARVAVAHFLGRRLQKSKRTGTSNWASPQLSQRQLLYAANDAHVALRLYRAWRQGSAQ